MSHHLSHRAQKAGVAPTSQAAALTWDRVVAKRAMVLDELGRRNRRLLATDDPELADDAKRFLDIYEGNVDAIEFVRLPIEIR